MFVKFKDTKWLKPTVKPCIQSGLQTARTFAGAPRREQEASRPHECYRQAEVSELGGEAPGDEGSFLHIMLSTV